MTPTNSKSAQRMHTKKWRVLIHRHMEVTPPSPQPDPLLTLNK